MMKNTQYKHLMWSIVVLIILSGCNSGTRTYDSYLNFSHLHHLTEEIIFLNDPVHIVHIYADYPDYEWVSAADSGPEGISCVDDVARAAVVYLRHYELTGDEDSLERAKPLIRFVKKMQLEDGRFYNFIFDDYSINTDGITSYPSFGWWAVRGIWVLGYSARIFENIDAEFAAGCKERVERSFPHIDSLLTRSGEYVRVGERDVPAWLIYQFDTYSASMLSELLFGLVEFYASYPSDRVREYIQKFGEAFIVMQEGDHLTFPYAVFPSNPAMWHAWSNGQSQALAGAGRLLGNRTFIDAAEKEVRSLITRLAIKKMIREFHIDDPESIREFQQIAYNLRPMVVGALRVADATGNDEYIKLAGILTSWFFGNNVLETAMYDPATGRCFDGISDSETLNRNSGAESTIEALYAILEAEQYYNARRFFHVRKTGYGEDKDYLYGVYENVKGDTFVLVMDKEDGSIRILEDESVDQFLVGVDWGW
jgi:hypothetical protein